MSPDRPLVRARIRLAIVDDHPLLGQGVASLLAQEAGIDVIGIGSSLADAAALLARHDPPDVMLLDVKLGPESGLDLLPGVQGSHTAVIVLTAHDYGPYLAASHRLGAAGFVVKDRGMQEIAGLTVGAFMARRTAAGIVGALSNFLSLPLFIGPGG